MQSMDVAASSSSAGIPTTPAPSLLQINGREISDEIFNKNQRKNPNKNKIPVTILTGFLGAGKTTLVRRILEDESHKLKIAVVQNEFTGTNEMGIETATLVDSNGDAFNELYELPNGCICCSAKDDFVAAIDALVKRQEEEEEEGDLEVVEREEFVLGQHQPEPDKVVECKSTRLSSRRFDYIVVEAAGLADPTELLSTFWVDDGLDSKIFLDGVVAVVDTPRILQQLDQYDEAAKQLYCADVVLCNKVDLLEDVRRTGATSSSSATNNKEKRLASPSGDLIFSGADKAQVLSGLRTMNPDAVFLETQKCDVDIHNILHLTAFDAARTQSRLTEAERRYLAESSRSSSYRGSAGSSAKILDYRRTSENYLCHEVSNSSSDGSTSSPSPGTSRSLERTESPKKSRRISIPGTNKMSNPYEHLASRITPHFLKGLGDDDHDDPARTVSTTNNPKIFVSEDNEGSSNTLLHPRTSRPCLEAAHVERVMAQWLWEENLPILRAKGIFRTPTAVCALQAVGEMFEVVEVSSSAVRAEDEQINVGVDYITSTTSPPTTNKTTASASIKNTASKSNSSCSTTRPTATKIEDKFLFLAPNGALSIEKMRKDLFVYHSEVVHASTSSQGTGTI
ncbi:unnamed protein product [Amoebophrya sp. A25]|nr:unnamed protein product [Amoebophrya sp. A25]|eukprot:GSA25T00024068001.1